MIFVTTLTKQIYDICGKRLFESFIETGNHKHHQLYVFFEDENDPYTDCYPDWLVEWSDKPYIVVANLMTYEYEGRRLVDYIDTNLSNKIHYDHLYNSARSVKWFRPVAAMMYASEVIDGGKFSSIDADCLFTSEVSNEFFDSILNDYHIAFLGREHFKVMRHGNYDHLGRYVHTNTVEATDADRHTETGFIGYNLNRKETYDFIRKNTEYWIDESVLSLPFKTDCHTFDAVRFQLPLNYNNLCEPMGEVSPIGSRVIEDSVLGSFLTHHKGTIGPTLYANNKL